MAVKGTGVAATVSTGTATGEATVARATGGTALAGRATLAVLRVVVDLLDFVVTGSALGASESLTVAAGGSLAVAAAGALSVTGIAGAWVAGAWVAGAWVAGCATSGATWAIKAVEEKARTAAIAVIAGRIFAFLWVILR